MTITDLNTCLLGFKPNNSSKKYSKTIHTFAMHELELIYLSLNV